MASILKRQWSPTSRPRYEARVRVGGKTRSKSFATKHEAQDWAATMEGKTPSGDRTDNKLMTAAVTKWADRAEGSTQAGRKHLLENLGELGLSRVGDVRTADVQAWRRTLAEGRPWRHNEALSAGTVSTLTRHLSAFFNEQVAADQIGRNPVLGARGGKGRVTKSESQAVDPSRMLTVAEVRALRDAADEPVRTLVELMATSGVRPNEAGGLRVRSVDLDAGVLHVLQQADGLYADWAWRGLKSDKSRRSIPLPESTLDALRAHLDRHLDYGPGDPLFQTERGYQWSTPNIGRAFAKVAKAAKVTGHSPKSLRHFYASKLIRAGEPVNVVQARLGHASPMVTLEVYTHLWEDAHDTTRAAVADLF